MIKTIEIEHFKGFYSRQKIKLANPDQRRTGSGLTIITGPNNTGKTTVIEALTFGLSSRTFKMSERHDRHKPVIRITTDQGWVKYSNIGDGSLVDTKKSTDSVNYDIDPISSRRNWNAEFSGESNMQSVKRQSIENLKNTDLQIAQSLSTIRRDSQKYRKLTEMMKRIIPHFTKWDVDTQDNNTSVIKYYTGDNSSHVANLLGEGIISLFRICAAFIDINENTTILIDEPEISLHPAAQKNLRALISDLSKKLQIVVCTHSPYFLDWKDFTNGAEFVRLNKYKDKQCTVNSLRHNKDYSRRISSSMNDWQKPHVLDTVTKEIFFADKILILEGQQDVGIIKKWLNDNQKDVDFDVFGYGAGGETNIPLYLDLCKDLGISKVAAVFDSNATQYTTTKRAFTEYKIYKLHTEDIVDKEEYRVQAKVGSFDTSATLKPIYRAGFEQKISLLENYFSD